MKLKASMLLLGLCTLSAGCVYYVNAARNLTHAPIDAVDEFSVRLRNKRLAKEAWLAVSQTDPPHEYSVDYERGFKEGFADYLYAGGKGIPPEVPPYCYRKSDHNTPDGVRAVQDWYAGFRHGASVARESGDRDLAVLPTATQGPFPEFDSSVRLTQRPGQTPGALTPLQLPAPRKAAPPAEDGKKEKLPPPRVEPAPKEKEPAPVQSAKTVGAAPSPLVSTPRREMPANIPAPTQGIVIFDAPR